MLYRQRESGIRSLFHRQAGGPVQLCESQPLLHVLPRNRQKKPNAKPRRLSFSKMLKLLGETQPTKYDIALLSFGCRALGYVCFQEARVEMILGILWRALFFLSRHSVTTDRPTCTTKSLLEERARRKSEYSKFRLREAIYIYIS